eukprot:m.317815 g.317815  ORF g.317815 m.317815 type:complete len:334 (+) comp15987_c1_seq2:2019-3020(+)
MLWFQGLIASRCTNIVRTVCQRSEFGTTGYRRLVNFVVGGASTRGMAMERAPCVVEIEKKFKCTPRVLHVIQQRARDVKPAVTFYDVYMDTEGFTLSQEDYWLRQRGDSWELKCPRAVSSSEPTGGNSMSSASDTTVDVYEEWTDAASILARLNHVTTTRSNGATESIHVDTPALQALAFPWKTQDMAVARLFPVARIETERTRYVLESQGFTSIGVDVDVVRFFDAENESDLLGSYEIAEVEAMIEVGSNSELSIGVTSSQGQVVQRDTAKLQQDLAVKALYKVLADLGVTSAHEQSSPRGKVLEYIARFSPDHLNALKHSGLLQRKLGSSS